MNEDAFSKPNAESGNEGSQMNSLTDAEPAHGLQQTNEFVLATPDFEEPPDPLHDVDMLTSGDFSETVGTSGETLSSSSNPSTKSPALFSDTPFEHNKDENTSVGRTSYLGKRQSINGRRTVAKKACYRVRRPSNKTRTKASTSISTRPGPESSITLKSTRAGVHFGIDHDDTKKWRETVSEFSKDYDRYPKWTDTIVLEVVRSLKEEGVCEFFVCVNENGYQLKKKIQKNRLFVGNWKKASDEQIMLCTKQRFWDDRKRHPKGALAKKKITSTKGASLNKGDRNKLDLECNNARLMAPLPDNQCHISPQATKGQSVCYQPTDGLYPHGLSQHDDSSTTQPSIITCSEGEPTDGLYPHGLTQHDDSSTTQPSTITCSEGEISSVSLISLSSGVHKTLSQLRVYIQNWDNNSNPKSNDTRVNRQQPSRLYDLLARVEKQTTSYEVTQLVKAANDLIVIQDFICVQLEDALKKVGLDEPISNPGVEAMTNPAHCDNTYCNMISEISVPDVHSVSTLSCSVPSNQQTNNIFVSAPRPPDDRENDASHVNTSQNIDVPRSPDDSDDDALQVNISLNTSLGDPSQATLPAGTAPQICAGSRSESTSPGAQQAKKVGKHWSMAMAMSVLSFVAVLGLVSLFIDQKPEDGLKGGDIVLSGPTHPGDNRHTLDAIRSKGYLACGVLHRHGFSMFNATSGGWSGFEVDLCRAVAVALFGEDGRVDFTSVTNENRFSLLQSGQVDLLAAGVTYTMERDLYEPFTKAGFTFSYPYLYNALKFAGQPQFVDCAESKLTTGNCTNFRICVQDSTTHKQVVNNLFNDSAKTVLAKSQNDLFNGFVRGQCNVLAGEQFDLPESNVRQAKYTGSYEIGKNRYSKEPLALVTRDGDAEWSDFVNWVFLALLTAETRTINQAIANDAIQNPGPSVDLNQLSFYRAVAAVGNYGELYNRHLQAIIPRGPVDEQNNGTKPLIFSLPFGNSVSIGLETTASGTWAEIYKRGYLRCGVGTDLLFSKFNEAGQQWSGLGVSICKAISAAIFNGKGNTVFVELDTKDRFAALANGTIDVLVRATGVSNERDVQETQTNVGFTFSPPIFYTGLRLGGIPEYSDCANNLDVTSSICKNLKICVNGGTSSFANTRKLFPESILVPVPTEEDVYKCLENNASNVIAGFGIFNETVRQYYHGPYKEGSKLFSRDNLAPVTRQDDEQWSSFVTWIVYALFYAEEQNITQATYEGMPQVNLFGESYTDMFRHAIRAGGSYGEVYDQNPGYPRTPINQLNHGNGPLHYPPPGLFGLY